MQPFVISVSDASGHPIAFVHQDTVAGQLDVGFSDKEWHDFGFNQLVKDDWDLVKNTRVETRLHVSTDPFQVTETLIAGLFIALGVVIGSVSLTKACPEGNQWNCGFAPVGAPDGALMQGDPSNPGVGLEYQCRCEFQ